VRRRKGGYDRSREGRGGYVLLSQEVELDASPTHRLDLRLCEEVSVPHRRVGDGNAEWEGGGETGEVKAGDVAEEAGALDGVEEGEVGVEGGTGEATAHLSKRAEVVRGEDAEEGGRG